MRRVAVIGLDCAAPLVVFDRLRGELPNLDALMKAGGYGPLRSCHPPITVPAWACMMSGRDAGEIGLYGFRNRKDYSYDGHRFASSADIEVTSVWDELARHGARAILLGVPPSFPAREMNGERVSCFMTPSTGRARTWPRSLADEIESVAPGYAFDVDNYRGGEARDLLRQLHDLTEKHFALARHLVRTRPWDFFAMVEIATDRLHHGFWRYLDPSHPHYSAGAALEEDVISYYRSLDAEVGRLVECLGDETVIMVVSDHGAQPMRGGVCLNEWLIERGYLVVRETPSQPSALRPDVVDWSRTKAWADGGYYGRVFLNIEGREPDGILSASGAEQVVEELRAGLPAITGFDGGCIGAAVHRPSELFRQTRGVPPDLIVYFGDLAWRSIGSIGHGSTTTDRNDTGPDDANHDWQGILILRDSETRWGDTPLTDLSLMNIAATILDRGGVASGALPGEPIGERHVEACTQ